jgi:hypothetical protein
MLEGAQAWRRIGSLALGAALAACGPAPAKAPVQAEATVASPKPAAAESAPVAVASEPRPEARESPGFAAALASLRPAATESALQRLAAAPADPQACAQAALAYAPTDVPAMTLLWGLSYQAMGGGSEDAAVAAALAKLLSERITATRDEESHQVNFNVRLAPGQMPVRKDTDGAVRAPLAHVFETLFSPAVTGFRPPWTMEQFYDVLSTWVGIIATHGTPLDEALELHGWLVTLAKAGHLEAFCYQLLGPAFPPELKAYKTTHGAELKAYSDYVKRTPLRPKRGIMPDELVRIQ